METKIEPLRLRGHHIFLIREFNRIYRNMELSECDFNPIYGNFYMKKYGEICKKILDGFTPIKLIDEYDVFCENCQCKKAEGCLHSDFFEPEKSIAQTDNIIAKRHKMEIGRTYEGLEFLRMLQIDL